MKWIGVGIAAVIIIATIFIVVKLVGAVGTKPTTETTTAESSIAETSTADQSNMVTVPDVTGMTEEEAKVILNEKGLGYKVTKQPSDKVAKGIIITQSQKANSKVAKNTTITLSISDGATTVTVQSQVGKAEADASTALKDLGFTVDVQRAYSDSVAMGNVISQTPNSGSVNAASTVTIVVSRGKENKDVTVPDMSKMTESEARQTLDELGLVVATEKKSSDKIENGYVISQNYSAGKSLAAGTTITLVISTGPEATTAAATTVAQPKVPNVVGMTQKKAEDKLKADGFTFVVTPKADTAATNGTVISQTPLPESPAEPGSTITIVVSTGA